MAKTGPSYRDLQENLTTCGKEIADLHSRLADAERERDRHRKNFHLALDDRAKAEERLAEAVEALEGMLTRGQPDDYAKATIALKRIRGDE